MTRAAARSNGSIPRSIAERLSIPSGSEVADRGCGDHAGLSLAKHGEISFKNGRVEQGNFDGFPVVRMDESPHGHQRPHHAGTGPISRPAGVGEPGLPPFYPRR